MSTNDFYPPSQSYQEPLRTLRRLPVFFLLDTSQETIGTIAVALQQGLSIVRDQLQRDSRTAGCAYLSYTLFGEHHRYSRLCSPWYFEVPYWQAAGPSFLLPAVEQLRVAFQTELLVSYPGTQEDYPPLIFLLLGSQPLDQWQETAISLTNLSDRTKPLFITLVTDPALVPLAQPIGRFQFQLARRSGECMTDFFYWAAQAIGHLYERYFNEASITLPTLPTNIIRLR